jgi:hypothetical protein
MIILKEMRMARLSQNEQETINAARKMLKQAETLEQLRAAQAILLPALLDATIEQTAGVLGVSTAPVSRLRSRFKTTPVFWGERRGGRRNALMSLKEEEHFLKPWARQARDGSLRLIHACAA